MKSKVSSVVASLPLIMLLSMTCASAEDWNVKWYAGLYPANPDYIKVAVDTHEIPSNGLMEAVDVEVVIVARQTANKVYRFTDGLSALHSGKVYVRYFPLNLESVREIKPRKLSWAGGASGGKFDTPTPSAPPSSGPIAERDLFTAGSTPPARRTIPSLYVLAETYFSRVFVGWFIWRG
jgi:hypothetical protein